ncbi:tRNA (adenosine(37)-N6)-threonylcarbamoyltransferase complex ATPase subunit type 1 TsaE [Candidatus Hepatincolaceae symbiont of Richtersius coronifer]
MTTPLENTNLLQDKIIDEKKKKSLLFISNSLEDTAYLANKFAKLIKPSDVICLEGELGAGKTAFSKKFIANFTNDIVKSPTFPIMYTYPSFLGDIYHIDLYRINSAEELQELNLGEIMHNHVCLIEWPNKLAHFYPKHPIKITIQLEDEKRRFIIEINADDDRFVADNKILIANNNSF